jgi:acetyl-CoA carboxylase biotin carboxylase subunit
MTEYKIDKILVANRGEIAVRIMRTAQNMGIGTVAVYSDADRFALHVQVADEAVHIGPSDSTASYLNIKRIIDAAKLTHASAIHPGYGFLSENANFAEAVAEAGLIFIGPNTHAINIMGSKLAAKDAVKPLGVPMVPGTDHAVVSAEEAIRTAKQIGYPVLIKASAGGGGKGMRVVEREEELIEQMDRAVSEAKSSFGDGSVFIEKYILQPRHIEVQVLFDNHGHGVYLFDRECSIQRRHQKVIEEAPANDIPDHVRNAMGEAAIKVGQSVDYTGAGTVEFLVDQNHDFYFLEMNTRLQVEHPVTELIAGIDLVEHQIRVAKNEMLAFRQDDLIKSGHAIELRIYAEDPENDFLPSTGTLEKYQLPSLPGIRIDHGYIEGQDIPIYYDPMIAKLVSYGKDRDEAISRLRNAIYQFKIEGIKSTLPFGLAVLRNPTFLSGHYATDFIKIAYSKTDLLAFDHEPQFIAEIGKFILNEKRNLLNI